MEENEEDFSSEEDSDIDHINFIYLQRKDVSPHADLRPADAQFNVNIK